MRADCLALCLRIFANRVTRQGALQCAPELTPKFERTGGWEFMSGGVEVLPGVRWVGGGALSGRAVTEPLPLRSPVFFGLRQMSKKGPQNIKHKILNVELFLSSAYPGLIQASLNIVHQCLVLFLKIKTKRIFPKKSAGHKVAPLFRVCDHIPEKTD